jgi:hypothetical protein
VTNARGGRHAPVTILLLLGLLPIACSTSPVATRPATSVPPTASVPSVPSTGPTAAPVVTPEPTDEVAPTSPGQSQTAWGPIWNAVPDWFPVPIDAGTSDPIAGPVSGAWTVPMGELTAVALARFYRDALVENGWLANVDGPLEDGSYTIASVAAGNCRTLTTILPRGTESLVTVLFGASCLFQ